MQNLWSFRSAVTPPPPPKAPCRGCGLIKLRANLMRAGSGLFCPACAYARARAHWAITPQRPTTKRTDAAHGLVVEDLDRAWLPWLRPRRESER